MAWQTTSEFPHLLPILPFVNPYSGYATFVQMQNPLVKKCPGQPPIPLKQGKYFWALSPAGSDAILLSSFLEK